jgi:hypothetical protein
MTLTLIRHASEKEHLVPFLLLGGEERCSWVSFDKHPIYTSKDSEYSVSLVLIL